MNKENTPPESLLSNSFSDSSRLHVREEIHRLGFWELGFVYSLVRLVIVTFIVAFRPLLFAVFALFAFKSPN